MSKKIDMTGWKMWEHGVPDSKIIVIKEVPRPEQRKGTHTFWECQCTACNEIFIAEGTKLRNGHTKSNGCWQNKNTINIGDRFGKLTIIKLIGPKNNYTRSIWYECKCDCGNIIQACGKDLRYGSPKSCGCITADIHLNQIKQKYKNKTYNFLTAIEPTTQRTSNGSIIWHFKCICGKDCYYNISYVKNNIILSCGCKSISYGELEIKKILDKYNINYIYNKQFFKDLIFDKGILRYDFIILDENNNPIRIIEFDGKQHFQSINYFGGIDAFNRRKQLDAFKNQYALTHNIPLIRIPYTELNNISYDLLFSNKFLIKENTYVTKN